MWTPRATRIAREIAALAKKARAESLAEGGPAIDLGTREWNTFQWLGATAVLFVLGVIALGGGVAALSESWSADRVQALFGLVGGPFLIGMAILGLVFLRPEAGAGKTGRHAKG